ncbi:hypothetical protein [Piscinibacter sp.]|uniref:hypothetical protein n=1 Tax=Piscinibacter sp. TaxID=1903157 RepID=UPI002BF086EC|nr:hypothetical protein [Albitalea sp.]HUG24501.1 hypothetical protein [Albitalea sp.]
MVAGEGLLVVCRGHHLHRVREQLGLPEEQGERLLIAGTASLAKLLEGVGDMPDRFTKASMMAVCGMKYGFWIQIRSRARQIAV